MSNKIVTIQYIAIEVVPFTKLESLLKYSFFKK